MRFVGSILILGLAAVAVVSLASFQALDWPAGGGSPFDRPVDNLGGPIGALFAATIRGFLGPILGWGMVLLCLVWAWSHAAGRGARALWKPLALAAIILVFASAFLSMKMMPRTPSGDALGGELGGAIFAALAAILGEVGASILLFSLLSASVIGFGYPRFRPTLGAFLSRVSPATLSERIKPAARSAIEEIKRWFRPPPEPTVEMGAVLQEPGAEAAREVLDRESSFYESRTSSTRDAPTLFASLEDDDRGAGSSREKDASALGTKPGTRPEDLPLPSLELLTNPPIESTAFEQSELLRQSGVLESKLADYGIRGRVSHVRPGPIVTTFEFEPAPGVKISQITSRADDLALALMAQRLRMVAPIPGKAAVGIEIPNAEPQVVTLRQILGSEIDEPVDALTLFLGKTVTGDPFTADLTDMPHLLIAGATGSGKSVCINTLIISLLLQKTPKELRLLLIDPKMLELSAYQGIPHLLHPVITVPRDAQKALVWLVTQMEARYRLLAKYGVRSISAFNRKVERQELLKEDGSPVDETLPFFVAVVDELADLMITLGNEIETPLTRLAQMARAVGIHLVLATQRPSVDVITGVIKANFPSRIAFQVASRTDSRTILDGNGAENLLGRGDMLYLPSGKPNPIRVHGSFVSTEECEAVAEHWRSLDEGEDAVIEFKSPAERSDSPPEAQDELFDKAKELVILHQQGSISLLQRRLKVGYSRAARLMDILEAAGVVGPFEGSKAREVLIPPEALEQES